VVLGTVATDRDRQFLLNLQICNLYREERIALSLLPFLLAKEERLRDVI